MSILALILALVLDRLFPALRAYRTGSPLVNLWLFLERYWLSNEFRHELVPLVLLLPVLLIVWLFYQIFTASLLVFGLDLLVAFYCLHPNVINEDVDIWIGEIEAGKLPSRKNSQGLFGRANKDLYTIIFWFVVVGPLVVLVYRLLVIMRLESRLSSSAHWLAWVDRGLGWFEWIPAILSGFLFMIAGNFEAGSRAARSIIYFGTDIEEINENRLRKIGFASVAYDDEALTDAEQLRRTRGLLLRTLVLWLCLACLIEFWW